MTTLERHLEAHAEIVRSLPDEHSCSCGYGLGGSDGRVTVRWRAHVSATWREARTVRTVDALDALPAGTVVQEPDADHTWIRHGECWHCSCDGTGVPWSTETLWVDRCDPLIVLWVPEDGAA